MGEAYWDVVPELEGTPAQEMALRTHYGVGGNEEAPGWMPGGVGWMMLEMVQKSCDHQLRLVVEIPLFTMGFSTIPGGKLSPDV